MAARHTGRDAPTLESVAARAGVSRATAGRVLAGSPTVGDEAREAVLKAADELSYVTNRAARSLMTRRSDSIAFVVGEPEERFFADPHFALVLRGAHAALAGQDVQLVFSILADAADRERFERFARGGHLDGVVLLSLHGDDPLPQRLISAGVPVVLLGRPFSPVPGLTHVDADNVGGACSAVDLLVERGRTRLATITGPQDMTVATDRRHGFETRLSAHGLESHGAVDGDFSLEGGRRAMRELLEAAPELDGVFVANDLMALGALAELADSGRVVPDDLAVVGFDDSPLAASAQPALTTVRQPIVAMGEAVTSRLLQVIENGEPLAPLVVETEIVVRAST
ncbi:LacI family DNA-binding transcriptional regulator [Pseudonocardia sichuanensis]|uniref:LacI family transcriptional regulator n=1 Tax=Pseudonocardia kunmingensis TaxID=630975 RepID=A0A543D4I8_9PSEU|nr:LacI family DNA-binding transcriptional regulator [Pseudonocardia kunmingensis]TQM04260.1 LacI family transcriptional regulator [Pseudonocardia kunmingensis]